MKIGHRMVNWQVREQQRMGIALPRNDNTMNNNILAVAKLVGTDEGTITGLVPVDEELFKDLALKMLQSS